MLEFACRPRDELARIFREVGAQRTIGPYIVEKDFWVCWLLGLIFTDAKLVGHLIFKGGTSLSKVFSITKRFSEDIDLSVDPDWLGFSGKASPEAAPNRSQFDKRIKALEASCAATVRDRFLPVLVRHIVKHLPGIASSALTFEVDPATHSPVLLFAYPRAGDTTGSLRPQVKLEFGSLYDQRPTGSHTVIPLAAEVFPAMFREAACPVVALEAERTFWEKATILHAEYHRPADKPPPVGLSRHYYDLYCLSRSTAGERALADTNLLTRVRKHKQTYFRSVWAHYDTAIPGAFRLAPNPARRPAIERDYRGMADMFMATPPAFVAIMAQLDAVERRINGA
ncbi:MAG: nucleotidyl transferase AbiEii/AbiGii toxin family protein [PVC group bacterium]